MDAGTNAKGGLLRLLSLLYILEKQLGGVAVDITKSKQGSALEQLYKGQWQPD